MDPYTTAAWSIGGVQQLLSSYTGPILRVRRSSDNAQQDIGYLSNGGLDQAALLAFVGGGTGWVTKAYDQTGQGNHFAAGATGTEPKIVTGGVVTALQMNTTATVSIFESVNQTPGGGGGFSYFLSFLFRTLNAFDHIVANKNAATVGFNGSILQNQTTPALVAYYCNGAIVGSNFYQANYAGIAAGTIHSYGWTVDMTAKTFSMLADGVGISPSATPNTDIHTTYTADYIDIAGSYTPTNQPAIDFTNFAFYNTPVSGIYLTYITDMLKNGLAPASWPLDTYSSNIAYAYARKRLLASYIGPLYRVRRTTDNVEQDISAGVDGTDIASLATFIQNTGATLVKWYDQSGNGVDLAQATTSKQPVVVNSGVYLTNFAPDGADDWLSSATNVGPFAGLTMYMVGIGRNSDSNATPVPHGVGGTKEMYFAASTSSGKMEPLVGTAFGISTDVGTSDTARALICDMSLSGVANQLVQRTGGANPGYGSTSGSTNTSNIDAGPVVVFGTGNAGNYSVGQLRAVVGYSTVHSTATADAINTALT